MPNILSKLKSKLKWLFLIKLSWFLKIEPIAKGMNVSVKRKIYNV